MKYEIDGKVITIPDKEIEKLQTALEITKEEAIETWLVDNDIQTDETVEQLTALAKKNRITATVHQAKSTKPKEKKARPKREDPEKVGIVKKIADFLPEVIENIQNVQITNETKIIEFDLGENHFKLDLIRRNKPKN